MKVSRSWWSEAYPPKKRGNANADVDESVTEWMAEGSSLEAASGNANADVDESVTA